MTQVISGEMTNAVQWVLEKHKGKPLTLVCQPAHASDEVAQGNALARCLSLGLDLPIGGQGLSWRYSVTLLESLLPNLPPTTLALFAAEHAPEMARHLATLPGLEVILHFSNDIPDFATSYPLIQLGEKRSFRQPVLPREPRAALLRFYSHLKRQNWAAALELAVEKLPGQLPEHLDKLGWNLLAEGLAPRMLGSLDRLEGRFRNHPKVMHWRLLAALETCQFQPLLKEVKETLEDFEDAELRALYAHALLYQGDFDKARENVRLSLEFETSTIGLWVAGLVYQTIDPKQAQTHLEQALKRAEHDDQPLLQARISLGLSQTTFHRLEPKLSQSWAQWTLDTLELNQLHNIPLRLEAANMVITCRLYQGDTVGLEHQLELEARHLREANPRMSNILGWTQAEVLLYEGRKGEALERMQTIWARFKQRESLSMFGLSYVQCLLENGKDAKAGAVAEMISSVNQASDPQYRAKARLAYLVWRGVAQPVAVVEEMRSLLTVFEAHHNAYDALLTQLHLVRVLNAAQRPGEAEALLVHLEPFAQRFGRGIRAMVGPSVLFADLFPRFEGAEEDLVMEFLGGFKARLYGMPLALRQRNADLLTALVIKPEGMTIEQLALALYGELGNTETTRTEVKRTKKLVPINGSPFTIQVPYTADFLEVKRLLREGDLRGALNRYRGALLPDSRAPLIEEERMVIEEMLRDAAVKSNDPEGLLVVAELLGEDLEVWERAVNALPQIDPRRAIAEAQRRKILRSWN